MAHHFPKVFFEWAGLRIGHGDVLSLAGYDFPYLPTSLGEFPQLRSLHLENSGLRRIPESLTRLSQLLQLDVSENELTELPELTGLTAELLHSQYDCEPVYSGIDSGNPA